MKKFPPPPTTSYSEPEDTFDSYWSTLARDRGQNLMSVLMRSWDHLQSFRQKSVLFFKTSENEI